MKVFDEEVFGPVAPIIKAKDVEDVIKLANTSIYGL
jgi:succinate-semialdehyde dehydrogenase/glutarate-semialdehyde dehydrogenase